MIKYSDIFYYYSVTELYHSVLCFFSKGPCFFVQPFYCNNYLPLSQCYCNKTTSSVRSIKFNRIHCCKEDFTLTCMNLHVACRTAEQETGSVLPDVRVCG